MSAFWQKIYQEESERELKAKVLQSLSDHELYTELEDRAKVRRLVEQLHKRPQEETHEDITTN